MFPCLHWSCISFTYCCLLTLVDVQDDGANGDVDDEEYVQPTDPDDTHASDASHTDTVADRAGGPLHVLVLESSGASAAAPPDGGSARGVGVALQPRGRVIGDALFAMAMLSPASSPIALSPAVPTSPTAMITVSPTPPSGAVAAAFPAVSLGPVMSPAPLADDVVEVVSPTPPWAVRPAVAPAVAGARPPADPPLGQPVLSPAAASGDTDVHSSVVATDVASGAIASSETSVARTPSAHTQLLGGTQRSPARPLAAIAPGRIRARLFDCDGDGASDGHGAAAMECVEGDGAPCAGHADGGGPRDDTSRDGMAAHAVDDRMCVAADDIPSTGPGCGPPHAVAGVTHEAAVVVPSVAVPPFAVPSAAAVRGSPVVVLSGLTQASAPRRVWLRCRLGESCRQ